MLALERVPRSLEGPVNTGLMASLECSGNCSSTRSPQDAYEQLLDRSEIEQVRALLGSLNDRERMILRARYGLDGPERSLRDVGEQIGLSRPSGSGRSSSEPSASYGPAVSRGPARLRVDSRRGLTTPGMRPIDRKANATSLEVNLMHVLQRPHLSRAIGVEHRCGASRDRDHPRASPPRLSRICASGGAAPTARLLSRPRSACRGRLPSPADGM